MADRVCVMQSGRIEQVDVPATLYPPPATPFVAEFVGTDRIHEVITENECLTWETTVGVRTAAEDRAPGTAVDVLVRPEGLTRLPHAGASLMTTTFLGSVTRLGVLLDEDVMVYVDRTPPSRSRSAHAVEVMLTGAPSWSPTGPSPRPSWHPNPLPRPARRPAAEAPRPERAHTRLRPAPQLADWWHDAPFTPP